MRVIRLVDSAARVAGGILAVARSGDARRLRDRLARARKLAADRSRPDTGEAERWDLVDAAAAQMQESVARFERRVTSRLEGFEVSLKLLRHLVHAG